MSEWRNDKMEKNNKFRQNIEGKENNFQKKNIFSKYFFAKKGVKMSLALNK